MAFRYAYCRREFIGVFRKPVLSAGPGQKSPLEKEIAVDGVLSRYRMNTVLSPVASSFPNNARFVIYRSRMKVALVST